ncbi:MAG: twin-arginine translocase TatA/TatE family subunit [Alphaproteobacteria bacterium]|nr:twin-arginine translocase TatA/TatE family subunit [Alphaproteobacteria bacterium]
MFDFSLPELFLVIAVAILVIGPKEIPGLMHGLGRVIRRLQYVRYAFSQQFDDFLKTHDLEELRRGVNFEAPDTDEKAADLLSEEHPPEKQ